MTELSNFEVAKKAEMKRVIRCFQSYSSETRANHAASFRLGYQQRRAVGEYYYVHPSCPGIAFPTRTRAALAGMRTE